MSFRPGVLLHKNITFDRIIFKNTACTLWRTSRDEGAFDPRISSVKGLPVFIAPILQMIIDSPEVRHLGDQGPKDQGLLLPNSGVILELGHHCFSVTLLSSILFPSLGGRNQRLQVHPLFGWLWNPAPAPTSLLSPDISNALWAFLLWGSQGQLDSPAGDLGSMSFPSDLFLLLSFLFW